MMKLYNTLTRTTDTFTPLKDNRARIYSCGPTVYDHAHIGNLSSFIFADTLRRAIKSAGYDTVHAMNYTDVDDKTIRRSRKTYPELDPREALRKLTDIYIDLFRSDMQAVGNDIAAIEFWRATDSKVIGGMQQLIAKLQAEGFAYTADDGVYFSIAAYRKSGKTYGQLLELSESNTSEERIQNDEYDKDSVHDFALWKKRKEDEPSWDFTVDGQDVSGRPGWHIECSVMSRQALGQPFDIHTGGVDLIFPHHENEIAQSTAGEENPVMAQFFVHNEHIFVDGKKMSKSLGNFYTLKDITDKGYDPLAFRLLILQSHYRSQSQFTWDNLESAQNRLKAYQRMSDLQFQTRDVESWLAQNLNVETIVAEMQNDLNTPVALAALSGLATEAEERLIANTEKDLFLQQLNVIDHLLGLQLSERHDITALQKQLIDERETARLNKDFALSDKLREQLKEQGIGLRDIEQGTIWYRM